MATLLEKMSELIGATTHDWVNRALQEQSVAVITRRIEKANDGLEQLENEIARVVGDKRVQIRKRDGLAQKVASLTADAKVLLTAGKRDMAASKAAELKVKRPALDKAVAAVASLETEETALRKAERALELKVAELTAARDDVDRALRIAKSKERTVETIRDLEELLNESGAPVSTEWADQKAARADALLDETLANIEMVDPAEDPDVELELIRLEQELGLVNSPDVGQKVTVTVETE